MNPTHTVIQLTDLHVEPHGAGARYGYDTADVVAGALRAVEDSPLHPTAIVFTGDLTEDGLPEEYERLRAVVEPAVARIGAPAVFVAGNHDNRANLRVHLLGAPENPDPFDHTRTVGGLRIIALDTSVPERGYGLVEPKQLEWLQAELAVPAPAGTVLALHHPPLPTPVPLSQVIPLLNPGELAGVIAGSDVRIVIAGHTHVVSSGVLGGVPVWVGGPLATTLDGLGPAGGLRGLGTPTVSRIDLFDDGVLASSVPIDAVVRTESSPADTAAVIDRLRAALPA
ncbi:metallophosphoesterase [Actinomycetes bacterium KLBMP 9759]